MFVPLNSSLAISFTCAILPVSLKQHLQLNWQRSWNRQLPVCNESSATLDCIDSGNEQLDALVCCAMVSLAEFLQKCRTCHFIIHSQVLSVHEIAEVLRISGRTCQAVRSKTAFSHLYKQRFRQWNYTRIRSYFHVLPPIQKYWALCTQIPSIARFSLIRTTFLQTTDLRDDFIVI